MALPEAPTILLYKRHDSGRSSLRLVGPKSVAARVEMGATPFTFGVELTPGAARAAARAPILELRDRVLPLEDTSGRTARALQRRLDDASSRADCEAAVGLFLAGRNSKLPDPRVEAMLGRINRMMGDIALDEIADEHGISARQVRRLFDDWVGLSPRRVIRVARIRRAVALLRSRGQSLAGIAGLCGYHDQAHMGHEFKALLGDAPLRVL